MTYINPMPPYAQHIFGQFFDRTAQEELMNMGPTDVNWVARTKDTLDILLPRLQQSARDITKIIPERLGSIPALLSGIRTGASLIERCSNPELSACRDPRCYSPYAFSQGAATCKDV